MWHRHRMPPFQQVSWSNFCPARAAPVNCKCCYCEVETSRSNNGSAAKWSHKLTERDRQVLKRVVCKNRLICCNTHYRGPNCFWKQRQHMNSLSWRRTSLRSPCAMPSVSWSGVKLTTIGFWSSGNTFSAVMNHVSSSGRIWMWWMPGERYLPECIEANSFSCFGPRPLSSSEGKS